MTGDRRGVLRSRRFFEPPPGVLRTLLVRPPLTGGRSSDSKKTMNEDSVIGPVGADDRVIPVLKKW